MATTVRMGEIRSHQRLPQLNQQGAIFSRAQLLASLGTMMGL